MLKKFIIALSILGAICYAQANNSPNMNLPIPIPGVTSGPQWATDINASLTLIDQHNHTPGSGVQIPPAGLNINTNLTFNGNSATSLQASVYTPQVAYSTVFGVHSEGNDLYFVDGNGNDIQITSGGAVNATSSGISSGTATASFSAGVLIVNAASNTPANIQAASYLMGNNTANSKYLTLQPPGAMAANYSITFPSLPIAQSFMAIDTGGNISGYAAVSGGLTGAMIGSATVTGSNIAAATITSTNMAANSIVTAAITDANVTRAKLVAVGQQISSASGVISSTSASYVDATNLTVSITTTGRPVMVFLQSDGTNIGSLAAPGGTGGYQILRGVTSIFQFSTTNASTLPLSSVLTIDTPAAGTYTYKVQYKITTGGAGSVGINNAKLVAYEL